MKSIVNPAIGAFQTQTPGTSSRRPSRGWKAAVALALVLAPAGLASAQYDPSLQFSPILNPNGVWTYGYENLPLTSPFSLLNIPTPVPATPGPTINSWQTPFFGQLGVYDNGTATPQTVTIATETSLFNPGILAMNSGPSGQLALVQFTAPASGVFSIQGTFQGINLAGTSSSIYLLENNSLVLASGSVLGFGPGSDVTLTSPLVSLAVGDTLAYVVGGNPLDSMTALINAQVSAGAVPEPSALALFALALVPLGFVRKLKAAMS